MRSNTTDIYKRPLRDLRISLIDKCNFRCPYCMPKEVYGERYQFLQSKELMTFDEIYRLACIMVKLGVEKIRLTGGEPLLRKNLDKLIEKLSKIQGLLDLTLTTNGYLLKDMALPLYKAGLKRITVSLDSLDNEVFKNMNGRNLGVDEVIKGIESAAKAGFYPIKINCVVRKGINEGSILDLAKFCKEKNYIVRFIEYMDVGTLNKWNKDEVISSAEIINKINKIMKLEKFESNYKGEVAKRYKYKDGKGEIGVISSVSQPFCGDCTRMRLSSDGKIMTCLFASTGVDLKNYLRGDATDKELENIIVKTWNIRKDKYSEERATLTTTTKEKVEMYHIGG
ncbi:MAG: GTP 3',8-cyclase MoaA [SAR202 cluster bacterium]|nr:GTP 3',8-cyclase MoaA [SAR202 cluster bacterium]